jgi:hypothetical protein
MEGATEVWSVLEGVAVTLFGKAFAIRVGANEDFWVTFAVELATWVDTIGDVVATGEGAGVSKERFPLTAPISTCTNIMRLAMKR